ncbi:hypothetical protein, partial [Phenylobacterium sp.]
WLRKTRSIKNREQNGISDCRLGLQPLTSVGFLSEAAAYAIPLPLGGGTRRSLHARLWPHLPRDRALAAKARIQQRPELL